MADPITGATETLKILIEQAPVYAQTPQAQKVIEWVNNAFDAIRQYDENHKLDEHARRELRRLQESWTESQQTTTYTGASVLYQEGQTPQQILREMEQQARIEVQERDRLAKAQEKDFQRELKGGLAQSQREISEGAEIWQQQIEAATRSLEEAISASAAAPQKESRFQSPFHRQQSTVVPTTATPIFEATLDPTLEQLNPDIAAQMRELNRFNSDDKQGVGFLRTLSFVDDALVIPVVWGLKRIKDAFQKRQSHDDQKPDKISEDKQIPTTPVAPTGQDSSPILPSTTTAASLPPSQTATQAVTENEPVTKPAAPIPVQPGSVESVVRALREAGISATSEPDGAIRAGSYKIGGKAGAIDKF